MFDFIKNQTIFKDKYHTHSEAVIISCFFNPQKSPYRTKAFQKFYEDIKHLNHLIVECVIGNNEPQLPSSDNIQTIYSESFLWHKEACLNYAISRLPKKYKYVFWIDADVIFTNKKWLTDGVKKLKSGFNIIQPFEFCVHLEQDKLRPSYSALKAMMQYLPNQYNSKVWRSFSATYEKFSELSASIDYNTYSHVGFAWGAKREVLEQCKLYDKGLVGGADHIIALGAVGKLNHLSIRKSFTENLDEIYIYQKKLFEATLGKVGYIEGNLYHIWHGDIEKREYLKRIQDFTLTTNTITKKDSNGLYVAPKGKDQYVRDYFDKREIKPKSADNIDPSFTKSDEQYIDFQNAITSATIDMFGIPPSRLEKPLSFGGGDFGGGGAEGSYDESLKLENIESIQDLSLGNFS